MWKAAWLGMLLYTSLKKMLFLVFGVSEAENMLVVYYERTLIQGILKNQFVIVLPCSFLFFIVLKKVQESPRVSIFLYRNQKRQILHNPGIAFLKCL